MKSRRKNSWDQLLDSLSGSFSEPELFAVSTGKLCVMSSSISREDNDKLALLLHCQIIFNYNKF